MEPLTAEELNKVYKLFTFEDNGETFHLVARKKWTYDVGPLPDREIVGMDYKLEFDIIEECNDYS